MSWWSTLPTVLLFLFVLFVPGWFMLRALGITGLLAVAAAPAPVIAVLAGVGLVLSWLGIAWSLWTAALTLLVVVVVVEIVARRLPRTPVNAVPLSSRMTVAVVIGTLIGLAVQAAAYLPGMREPDALHQIHDAIFHLNATEAIVRSGNASSLSAIGELEGMKPGFYPMVFDSIAALAAPLTSVVVAVNVLMLVALLVIWPVGIIALARVVAPTRPLAAAVAPVVAASFIIFPANFIVLQGALPYGLALALAPGVAAVIVALLDRKPADHPLGWIQPAVIALVLVAGVAAAHPTGIAVLVVYVLPKCAQVTIRRGIRLTRGGRTVQGIASIALVPAILVALVVALAVVPLLRSMAANQADGLTTPGQALLRGFTTSTTIGSSSPWANWVIALLVVAGLTLTLLDSRVRWFGFSWLLTLGCFVLSSTSDSFWRGLTGFWYESSERTEAMLPTVTAVLVGIAVSDAATILSGLLQRDENGAAPQPAATARRDAVAVLVAVTILFLAYLSSGQFRLSERRDDWTAWGFQADRIIHQPYVTDDELAMIRSLPDVLPPSAVVLGDPFSGAPFVQGVAGLVAYIPALNPPSWNADQRYLMAHFAEIHTDPQVCEIVRESGIGYYYWDVENGAGWGPQKPGLAHVDTSEGFELVASADTAKVYRITACEPGSS